MLANRRIKVLVVDDSLLYRETIVRGISADRGIAVIGVASDPFEARDKIIELAPDVLTLDIEMPKMGGIEFLKRLLPQYPVPVVMVSAVSDSVFDALNAGAIDFVIKPDYKFVHSGDTFINDLIIKIKVASTAKVGHLRREYAAEQKQSSSIINNKIIAIGASTGGTEAIYEIIRSFPRDMPGIVIVQHMPPVFTEMYARRLNNSCAMEVREAKTGDVVIPGRVLIAPGDYHMKLEKKGNTYYVDCFKGEKVNGHCPSVDVLFHSVAEKVGANAIGIILTGMGYDGAKGLLNMKQKGALTIGQDQQSCVVYGMPKVAFDIGAVDRQVSLKNISHSVFSMVAAKH
ncbi:chemotaxis response regulator protein-glutamate methylesterase [Petroclostridium sp. X23]|uniref:protein-glutamate methylesterase/protein-glutamine glutaminase n=1 Tax=Petroclostridium sp. X23 TaxID=3045146 RepID=UPI0024AC8E72|nr:chemotaxis response regulator protein-glutamate methylesterase [Petroclostridium sp. X23]WHH60079.1 chemotaxis response regulator protein-glutamate methylesterase [Petroclostridium sp. X23]